VCVGTPQLVGATGGVCGTVGISQPCKQEMIPFAQPSGHPVPYPPESSQEGPMDIASVFEWFAQESKSIAKQAAEREQREKFAKLALLWASAAQQCSGGAPAMQSTEASG
jgi:hypothetical protein